TAAIHAIDLDSIRKKMVPQYVIENYEVVLANGRSQTGMVETDVSEIPLWPPVLPMAWDDDADPVLAIAGSALILLLPMQIWSKTLEAAKPVQKRIVLAWAVLLLIGTICALVNAAYVDFSMLWQLR